MALVGTISGSNGTSNTAVTGTLVIANVNTGFPTITTDAVLFVSGNINGTGKTVVGGDLFVTGNSILGLTSERFSNFNSTGGTLPFNLSSQSIFYVNNPTSDVTANFTNVPTTALRILKPTVILSQSSTPRIVSGVQIDGNSQTINWQGGITPTGVASKQNVFDFTLIRSGSAWKVLGNMFSFG